MARTFLGDDGIPEVNDLRRNFALVLVNTHFSLFGARPNVQNMVRFSFCMNKCVLENYVYVCIVD